MRKIELIHIYCIYCIITLLAQNLHAQPAPPNVDWFNTYDIGFDQDAVIYDIYSNEGNDLTFCGTAHTDNPVKTDIWLTRIESNGRTIWNRHYGEPNAYEYGSSLIQTDDGGFAVAGNGSGEIIVLKTNGEGEQTWMRTYGAGAALGIIELKEGALAICGYHSGEAMIAIIENDGEIRWMNTYGRERSQRFNALRETENGIITGGYYINNRQAKPHFVKVDFEGEALWQRYPDDFDWPVVFVFDMTSCPDGGFAFAGLTGQNVSGEMPIIIRTNEEGDVTWWQRYAIGENGEQIQPQSGCTIKLTGDNGFYYGCRYGNGAEACILRVGNRGDLIWRFKQDFGGANGSSFKSFAFPADRSIVAAGYTRQPDGARSTDGLVVRFVPERLAPKVLSYSPQDLSFKVLIGSSINYWVNVRDDQGDALNYTWTQGDSIVSRDTFYTANYPSLGEANLTARVSDANFADSVTWHVTVTDLYVSAYTPDTLDFAIRRGTSVDFSLDSVRYLGEVEPGYLWTVTNLNNGLSEVVSENSSVSIPFFRSGEYSVEGETYLFESNDQIVWQVTVLGNIRAYVPESPTFEILSDSLVHFEVVPSAPEDESLEVRWSVDGELVREGELALDWAFSLGEADSCPPYHVQCVVADSVEADSVQWVVTVNDLGIGDIKEVGQAETPILLSVSPNPFNSMLTIRYSTSPINREATLRVYDIAGREVFSVVAAPNLSGKITPPLNQQNKSNPFATPYYGVAPTIVGGASQTLVWDATAQPAGVFFIRLQSGRAVSTKKVVLMR